MDMPDWDKDFGNLTKLCLVVAEGLVDQLKDAYTPAEVVLIAALMQSIAVNHMDVSDQQRVKLLEAAHDGAKRAQRTMAKYVEKGA